MTTGTPPNLPVAWNNQLLTLYHGTVDTHVAAILAGVNVSLGRTGTDFGRGFYTTTMQRQAHSWAWQLALRLLRRGSKVVPAIIAFDVARDDLAPLEALWFVRGSFDADDFWSFVFHCRSGGSAHGRSMSGGWYDIVVGPVAASWQQRLTIYDADQIGFHTTAAAAVLNRSTPRRVL